MASRVTEIGFQYGVAVLRKKRSELAGEIDQLKLHLRHRRRDLAKVDDMLLILDPAADPSRIPSKKPIRYLNVFRQGELSRIILGLLRASQTPMTNLEIARAVMDQGGFDEALWKAMHRRTRANLAYLDEQQRVAKIGTGRAAKWMLLAQRPRQTGALEDFSEKNIQYPEFAVLIDQ